MKEDGGQVLETVKTWLSTLEETAQINLSLGVTTYIKYLERNIPL